MVASVGLHVDTTAYFYCEILCYHGICCRRVSVTLWYCIKTATCRTMQTMPYNSPEILVPKFSAKFSEVIPIGDNAGGVD